MRKKVSDLLPHFFPEMKQLLPICVLFVSIVFRLGAQSSSVAGEDYVLQPQDLLRVVVFQEDDLTREVRISRECSIQLPLIGNVNLKGKTLHEAETMIRDLYAADYLVAPQINLIVLEYASRTVNVLGAVNTPGVVVFPQEQGLTLLDAISRAGAFSRLANRQKIKLTRTMTGGQTENFTINADDLIDGSSSQQWQLQPGDVIYVPERIL